MSSPSDAPHTPPRLLYVVTSLHISGPSLQTILLTAALRERGYDAHLVTGATPDDSFASLATHYDIAPIIIPALTHSYNPVRHVRAVWALYKLFKSCAPDIVHTHTTTAGFLGRVAARWAGTPVTVHTLHVHPFRGHYTRLSTLFFTWTERLAASLSDSIITLSETLRRELTEVYRIMPRSWLTVLPAGYDLEIFARIKRYNGEFRRTHGISPRVPLVGIVGRLMAVKNHALFLQAAARLKQVVPEAHFVIVGDGELRSQLEALAQSLGLQDSVTFTGWVEAMTDVYSDLDVLVLSSHNEGTPVPIIEALAAGCPVVATQVGGVGDLLAWTGCEMVRPGDAAALTEAVHRALERPHPIEPARTMMMNRYHVGRLAEDLDGLYSGLLARKRRGKSL